MFSGIITYAGRFEKFSKAGFLFRIPTGLAKKITKGASIAVDGVCLTVKKIDKTMVYVDVMEETLSKTTLENLKSNDLINLELPVTPQTLLSGHIIQGHIDGLGKLAEIIKKGNSRILRFSIAKSLSRYIVSKGSIAISGISLTVIKAEKGYFTVGIIPYTWDNTMLHTLNLGDLVNIELDILAKYVEKLLHNERH